MSDSASTAVINEVCFNTGLSQIQQDNHGHKRAIGAVDSEDIGEHLENAMNGDISMKRAESRSFRIRTDMLDKYIPADEEILLMKIDTEGYEMSVLGGAIKTVTKDRVRNLIVEFKKADVQAKSEFINSMLQQDYHLWSFCEYYEGPLLSFADISARFVLFETFSQTLWGTGKPSCWNRSIPITSTRLQSPLRQRAGSSARTSFSASMSTSPTLSSNK